MGQWKRKSKEELLKLLEEPAKAKNLAVASKMIGCSYSTAEVLFKRAGIEIPKYKPIILNNKFYIPEEYKNKEKFIEFYELYKIKPLKEILEKFGYSRTTFYVVLDYHNLPRINIKEKYLTKYIKKQEDIDFIKSCNYIDEIIEKFGVNAAIARRILNYLNLPDLKSKRVEDYYLEDRLTEEEKNSIIKDYENGIIGLKMVAYRCGYGLIQNLGSRILEKWNIPIRPRYTYIKDSNSAQKRAIAAKCYKNRIFNLTKLAKYLNCCPESAKRFLKDKGIHTRKKYE